MFSYQYFRYHFISEAEKSKFQLIQEVMANLDFYFNELKDTLKITGLDEDVVAALSNRERSSYKEKLNYDRKVQSFLSNMNQLKPDLDDIIIVKKDGTVFEFSSKPVRWAYNFYDQPWFSKYDYAKAKVQFIGPHRKDYYYSKENETQSISAVYPVINIFDQDIFVGAVIAELNMIKISLILKRLQSSAGEQIILMDSSNQIIFSSHSTFNLNTDPSILNRINEEEKGYFVSDFEEDESIVLFDSSDINNWKVVMILPVQELTEQTKHFRSLLIIVLLISFPILSGITYAISNRIIKPIHVLMDHMAIIETGNFEAEVSNNSYEEIRVLNRRFNKMVRRINQLVNEVYKMEIEQKESQLRALQARINPHFLYNSLQTIKSMAMLGKTQEISKMVTSLGFLFRYAIGKEDYMVTIDEEMDHVKHYLNIQVRWLYKKCTVEYDISKEILSYKLPRLTLQPIVENIFKHGFKKMDSDYSIKISGWKEKDIVVLEVWDNGVGISKEKLQKVKSHLNTIVDTQSTSIGLGNVHRRIALKFGKEYGVWLESVEVEWTKVTLRFPMV
jgi:two-component system sensor histidine kinase YesM